MNSFRKQAAVKKIRAMQGEGKNKDEILDAMNSDDANYTSEEVVESLTAADDPTYLVTSAPPPTPGPNNQGSAGNASQNQLSTETKEAPAENLNRKYAEWKVLPVYEEVKDAMGKVLGRKLTGFKKDAQEPIKYTHITPARAEELNSQSANTLLMLYLVD